MGANVITGAFAGLFLLVSLYFLVGIRAETPNWHYDFENPAWGKFLVGAVYVGVTILCVWAFLHGHPTTHHGA